jgi:tRNA (guanosine-2'-O-)-methyltransferase
MDKDFLSYLEQFVSEERKSTFHDVLDNRTRHFTLVLEDLFQKHNVSAVIRSADVFGIQDLHIIENEYNNFISRRVAKGAQKWMTFYPYSKVGEDNTQVCIDKLKAEGYKIIVTSPHLEASDLRDFPIENKAAIVLGAEKNGVSQKMMDAADGFLKIPMVGFTESLNVSVAAALIMESLSYNLRKSDVSWQLRDDEKEELYFKWIKKSIQSFKEIERNYYSALKA